MATIQYKCDTCRREVDILERTTTLTTFSKCTITYGCKGKVYKIGRNPVNSRSVLPKAVGGLEDYIPRNSFREHNQHLEKDVWRIRHDLKTVPVTFVYIWNGDSLEYLSNKDYSLIVINKDVLELRFHQPVRGIVQCVARSSVHEYEIDETIREKNFQVTYRGFFTFGFPKYITHYTYPPQNHSPLPIYTGAPQRPIRIEVSLIQPNREEIVCTETIQPEIDTRTPWSGWSEVLVRKRREYTLHTKSIFDFKRTLQLDTVSKTDIQNGSQIRFLRIDYGTGVLQPIGQDEVLLFLSEAPYNPVDKKLSHVIDVGNVLVSNKNYFTYRDGEVYTDENNLESTYPPIQRVVI